MTNAIAATAGMQAHTLERLRIDGDALNRGFLEERARLGGILTRLRGSMPHTDGLDAKEPKEDRCLLDALTAHQQRYADGVANLTELVDELGGLIIEAPGPEVDQGGQVTL